MKGYVNAYQNKGANVYLVFTPIYHVDTEEQTITAFCDKLKTSFGDIVLGNPTDWILRDSTKFYDTGYYLTREASLAYTEYYYELIKQTSRNK